jgi:hypothetical protein
LYRFVNNFSQFVKQGILAVRVMRSLNLSTSRLTGMDLLEVYPEPRFPPPPLKGWALYGRTCEPSDKKCDEFLGVIQLLQKVNPSYDGIDPTSAFPSRRVTEA